MGGRHVVAELGSGSKLLDGLDNGQEIELQQSQRISEESAHCMRSFGSDARGNQ